MNIQDHSKLELLRAYYSNERTFLSYIRTSSSVLVLAVALLKFFEDKTVVYLGWGALVVGLAILILGIIRYWQERNHIRNIKRQ